MSTSEGKGLPAAVELAINELRELISANDRGLYVARRGEVNEFDAYIVGRDLLRRQITLDEVNSASVQFLFMIFTLLYLDIKRYPEREKNRYAKRIGLGEGYDEQRFRAMGLGVQLDDPIQFIITRDPSELSRD